MIFYFTAHEIFDFIKNKFKVIIFDLILILNQNFVNFLIFNYFKFVSVSWNPKSSSKLITNPISPETSTNENPMKAYRNNSSLCEGFLPMDISNEP